jgi:hypothetical protein
VFCHGKSNLLCAVKKRSKAIHNKAAATIPALFHGAHRLRGGPAPNWISLSSLSSKNGTLFQRWSDGKRQRLATHRKSMAKV